MLLPRRTLLSLGLGALLGALLPRRARAAPEAAIRVDPVLEWWSALARAAGFSEYQRGLLPGWNEALDQRLARIRGHRVLDELQRARARSGVSFDAIPSLAAHVSGPPEAMRLRVASPLLAGLDRRWEGLDLERLLAHASKAAALADFSGLLAERAALVERVEAALRAVVADADLGWFEAFFGTPLDGRLVVVAGLSNGPNNYGAHATLPEGGEVWAALGVSGTDEAPVLGGGLEVLIHEIGHSFVGAVRDAHEGAFEAAGARLFARVEATMRANNYGSWPTMVEESLLRAAVVRYLRAHQGEAAAEEQLKDEAERGFPWVRALDEQLTAYEADRARYPTLGDLVPELAAVFEAAADAAEARAADAPRLLSMVPANGDRRVDPTLMEMVLRFDRPMKDPGWSLVGGGPAFPEIEDPRYDETRTVWTARLRLEPGHDYELWLNSARYTGFRSEGGAPLEPVHVVFSTRKR